MSKAVVMKAMKDGGQLLQVVDFPEKDSLDFFYKTLECDLIDIVGCHGFRGIPGIEDIDLVVDDEGLLKDTPALNILASICYGFIQHGSPIVGHALLCKHDSKGDSIGLTEKEVELVQKELGKRYGQIWDKVREVFG